MDHFRLAVRTLRKTPFITGVAVVSLALGIGANAAIFSLFDQLLLRALPVEEPDRLVNLAAPAPKPGSQSCNQAGGCDAVFSYPMFRDLQRAETGLAGLAAHRLFGANLAYAGSTANGEGMLVSGSYFPLLGVQPALGRLLGPLDDETIGAHSVAVLGHAYWENQLGADPSALNATVIVNGHPLTVVGVAPRGFRGTTLGADPDLYVPISMRDILEPWSGQSLENRRSYWAYVFGRLGPDTSLEQAAARINTVYAPIINEVEAPLQEGMSPQTLERFRSKQITMEVGGRGQSSVDEDARTPLILLLSITGLVLLIACANIANLLLAKGVRRGPEMAVRGSLGASRRQLLAQLLAESCVLAVLGGLASLVVARWTLGAIGAILPAEAVATVRLELSASMVLFAAAVSIGTGVAFGLYPALHATRPDLAGVLRADAGQPSGALAAARFRSSLVTAQIALSMALLVASGLFLKSLINVSRVDLGIDPENVVMFGIAPQLNGYEPERTLALFEQVEDELAAIPGVSGVSAALVPLLGGSNWGTDVAVEGFESGPDIDSNSRYNEVGAAYFGTLGIPLLAGREFSEADAASAPKVAVVNETFTEKFGLGGREAVGKWMSTSGGAGADELDIQIVGVVQDAKYSEVKQVVPPLFFTPYRQDERLAWMTFYVRSRLDPTEVLRAVPAIVDRLDPNLPVEDLHTLEQQVRDNVFMDRMISTLSAAFALLATLLAAIGLYGVLAYTVAQRTREIGLRMALGAGSERVRDMVLGQVARMTIVGGIIGLVAAYAMGRAAQSLLFEMEPTDPLVMIAGSTLLAAVAFAAGYLPARRASKVDPMRALRYE
jgi:predicted permease